MCTRASVLSCDPHAPPSVGEVVMSGRPWDVLIPNPTHPCLTDVSLSVLASYCYSTALHSGAFAKVKEVECLEKTQHFRRVRAGLSLTWDTYWQSRKCEANLGWGVRRCLALCSGFWEPLCSLFGSGWLGWYSLQCNPLHVLLGSASHSWR